MESTDNRMSCGECSQKFFKYHCKGLLSILIPILCSPILFIHWKQKEYRCLYVIAIMAIYWIAEVIPFPITALIPILLFPLLGIMGSNDVCIQYFRNTLVLLFGSLVIGAAIEYCNLHKRVALKIIMIGGVSPRRLQFSLMFMAMLTSMWLPNAAVVAMMCPIIRALLNEFDAQKLITVYEEDEIDEESPNNSDTGVRVPSKMSMAFYLGIAYAATIGGYGTLIGMPTNLAFKGIYESRFPNATEEITFPLHMGYCIPLVLIDIAIVYVGMCITHMGLFRPKSKEGQEIIAAADRLDSVIGVLKENYTALGPITLHEIQVIFIILMTVFLLFFHHPGFMAGWDEILNTKPIKNSLPVMLAAILLFIFPIKYTCLRYFYASTGEFTTREIPSLLNWNYVHKNVPWGLIFLLGGGYAVAEGIRVSGMSKLLGESMKTLDDLPHFTIQLLCIFVATVMTTFSADVAICNILLPIVAELAIVSNVHPLYLMMPTAFSCCIAFLLPVSTAVNSIISVFANINVKNMAIAGIIPTVSTILLIMIFSQTWQLVVYPKSASFPDWAQ